MNKRFAPFIILTGLFFFTAACQGAAPAESPTPSNTPGPTPVPTKTPFVAAGTDISVSLPPGDPDRGQRIAGARDCVNCHANGIGPMWTSAEGISGLADRAEERFSQADYTGSAVTAEQYLFESIVLPSIYIVEGYPKGLMPDRLGDLMSAQDMADIIAYLLTFH